MSRLIALPFSPWSEKARWALDHHRIDYRYEEHIVGIGELKLRLLLGKPFGRVSVPIFEDNGQWIEDSFAIARYADRIGGKARLVPDGKLPEVADWNRRSEDALAAGRALMMLPILQSPAALRASLPPGIPDAVAPFLEPITRAFIKRFVEKYQMEEGEGSHERIATDIFTELRAALKGGKRYLLGEFSYADIAMAATLQFVTPVSERFMVTGPGGREAWTNRAFADRFPDLLAWRDSIYEEHRGTGA